jgi:hypothetical protein
LETHAVHLRLHYLDELRHVYFTCISAHRIRNGHQTTTVTTTSHRSREMVVSLGPQGTLVTGMKIEPVTMKLTSETCSMNLCLRGSAFSRLKEMRAFNQRLLYLHERARSWSPPSGLVTAFYTACYIIGMFVTGFPNEARYSLISVCNEL